MNDKLVTLAIQTFEQAQILKGILESEGIEVFIHNVNLIQPTISAGVRVRIKESDLNKALKISDKIKLNPSEKEKNLQKTIVVPIDFSEQSKKACYIAFNIAQLIDAEVILLHAYFSQLFSPRIIENTIYNAESENYEKKSKQNILKRVLLQLSLFENSLKEDVKQGFLPDIKFSSRHREGVPEDVILNYTSRKRATIIVMGSRGCNKKDFDLIGSVAAEVIERSAIPVLIIPEKSNFDHFLDKKNIAYITNFESKDLLAFDKSMQLLKAFKFDVHFIINEKIENSQLAQSKEYFSNNYPEISFKYSTIKSEDLLENLDSFITENEIDVLALTTHKRSVFARLFNPSIAHEMIFHINMPIFVFHS